MNVEKKEKFAENVTEFLTLFEKTGIFLTMKKKLLTGFAFYDII